jgi:hypothetical protein
VKHAALAAALIVAALPAAAQAADYAGGTVPATKGSSGRQLTLVGIRTAADGTARVSVKVATCIVATVARRVPVAADGTFALDMIVRGRVREDRRLRQRTRMRMSGVLAGTAASGTVRADVRLTRRGRTINRCTSGTRAWQARAAVAEPTAAAPQANGAYHGLTSQAQGRPLAFLLRVDPRARRVRTTAFEYRQRCRRGGFSWENITPGARIAADGSFRLRERFSFRWIEGLERFRVRVDGHFTTSGVTGTLSVTSVLRSPSGRVLDRCSTGRLGFAALL